MAVAVMAGGCSGGKRPQQAAPTTTTEATAVTPTSEAPPTTAAKPKAKPSGPFTLASFTSCNTLLRHVKKEALRAATPWGIPSTINGGRMFRTGALTFSNDAVAAEAAPTAGAGGSAGGPAPKSSAQSSMAADSAGGASFSGTNIQEAGVDEPDMIKSDGRRLVTLFRNQVTITDLTGPAPKVVGSLDLPREDGATELLLLGDRVVVFGHAGVIGKPAVDDTRASVIGPHKTESVVRIIDIAKPAAPAIVSTMKLDGNYVSARLAAGVIRLVVHSAPMGPTVTVPMPQVGTAPPMVDEAANLRAYKDAIQKSKLDDWMPTYTLERAGQKPVTEPVAPCSAFLRPKDFGGLDTVSVLTFDPANPQPANPACVLGGGRIVYAGNQNLYVATEKWDDLGLGPAAPGAPDRPEPAASTPARVSLTRTQLHQFAIPGREPAEYVASGEVEGSALNQFSMSEHAGHLRIATTVRKADRSTDNRVYVLAARDGRLVEVGRVAGLGHEGESIQSVRFIGDRGYVVTFRQTDPLYVLDLRNPAKPKATGELQVPGFSSYLHPLNDRLLLGVGVGPGDAGGQGFQVSLFDVGDPARPTRLANKVFENSHSYAQQDHHAFLWWPASNTLVVPLAKYDSSEPQTGALVLPVDLKGGFGKERLISHQPHVPKTTPPSNGEYVDYYDQFSLAQVYRAMVSDGRLLTMSWAGVQSNDMATLAEKSWTAWPA